MIFHLFLGSIRAINRRNEMAIAVLLAVGLYTYVGAAVTSDKGEICSGTQQGFMAFDNVTYSRNEVRGQLQLCINRRWRAVCSLPDGFTEINSEVACYQMGFSGEHANSTRGGSGLTTTWMYNVVCQGSEETLLNCSYSIPNDTVQHMCLTKSQSVHIICPKESQVRLHNHEEGKIQDYRGVVEHYYNGTWHVLCDTGNWTLKDSQVVCYQLGLGEAVPRRKPPRHQPSKSYLANDINCGSSDQTVKSCRNESTWDISHSCRGTTTYVECRGPEVESIEVVGSTLRSVTIEWTLPKNFYIHNTVVVTLFRIEYWPENNRSLMRSFDRLSTFNSTTVDFLQPNTTYKIVVIAVMGEHHGPRGFTLTVSTGPSPSESGPGDLKKTVIGLGSVVSVTIVIIIILSVVITVQVVAIIRITKFVCPNPVNDLVLYELLLTCIVTVLPCLKEKPEDAQPISADNPVSYGTLSSSIKLQDEKDENELKDGQSGSRSK